MTAAKPLRCAIYTRVSSDAGLEQDFNSLQAQREAAEAFIKSQAHEGWRLRRDHYDDGGFSGGSMERPALQQLLADVAERRLDVIVVYKVDRLTRSLADFAKLVELFDRHGVSFVSVTQSFNTTTSMGRLTLNVLLSFAQFEREVTGERIRDKIAASKKKGIWMGGPVPLGYRVDARKLLLDEVEAETVRLIFGRYLELGSIPALQRDLRERGVRSRARVLASGKGTGDVPLTNGPLSHLLKNRTYLGELNHKGVSYTGEHPAIVPHELFAAVQAKLAANLNRHDLRKGRTHALLAGCLFDDCGNLMSPTHAVKKGVRYRYYVSTALVQGRKTEAGSISRVPALEVEAMVRDALREHVTMSGNEANSDAGLCKKIDLRATLRGGSLEISWIDIDAAGEDESPGDRHRIAIPFIVTPHKRRRAIILPSATGITSVRPIRQEEQKNLARSIAQGRGWLKEVMAGTTVAVLAQRENRSARMIRMMLSLAFLDPKLVQAVLHGALPRGISTRKLIDAPMLWQDQWQAIGLSRPN